MSLCINLSASETIILQPAETYTYDAGEIHIDKITDIPTLSSVEVNLDGIGKIKLDSLSDDNYSDWTRSQISDAVINYIVSKRA